ncbi:toll/interleukin-1 receptor domain-containing protein [Ktedonosporobacter rubrisoli]|uniref:Toll/interleukin-1 receptor domain-containing protein n=1 Tax=Ktedonosporobacter rubrisoli TaxID=2509675 RepID=A0A4P6JZW4_KTERU|nr:toll/interleukin-1 receptor domain-containing protein [Ktedonosporobacter rubrisoli]QBD81319.1 toll/interleukin-1 receptor domain-containing protein [Ktedonosporobacter rubrisoli]
MSSQSALPPPKVFWAYARQDESYLLRLKAHMANMRRQHQIDDRWDCRDVTAGKDWEKELDKHLEQADLIIWFISPYFLDSDYCLGKEMRKALELSAQGKAYLIPILLRPCDWKHPPFHDLEPLPSDRRPVLSWPDKDKAFLNIVQGICRILEKLKSSAATQQTMLFQNAQGEPIELPAGQPARTTARSTRKLNDRRPIKTRQRTNIREIKHSRKLKQTGNFQTPSTSPDQQSASNQISLPGSTTSATQHPPRIA